MTSPDTPDTPDTPDDMHAEWVRIASYNTGLEADIARQRLDEENIPVLVQSNSAGIFGASYQGGVTGGIILSVPSPEVERALALLDLLP